ncbi:MAG: imidazole glycerol phosphate synthase subunit HisH [Candidatus Sericytochromatia bacterium]|nr:imidazole glycerol phosphate synthase subunit HisH [Candidatus Sericytochromatia bacterium]
MITIVSYGVGNLGSMLNMFKRLGVPARAEADPDAIRAARKLVLPGVGAFDAAMARIEAVPGLREALDHQALVARVPVLGVCLGMQLLTRGSEEGVRPGLGWLAADTRRFPRQPGLKVPHMGWNLVEEATPSPLTRNLGDEPRYYFVHSYHVAVDDPADALLRAHHGVAFEAAIGRGNVFGVQFHPEKSHRFGMRLLQNFAEL